MKEHGIIFTAEEIRAFLKGRKSQVRRAIKEQDLLEFLAGHADETQGNTDDLGKLWEGEYLRVWCAEYPEEGSELIKPPYAVGDMIWAKETWAYINNYDIDGSENYYEYRADKPNDLYPGDWPTEEAKGNPEAPKWQSSQVMPRDAARIWREIVGVKVERLQGISDVDCIREGIPNGAYAVNPKKSFEKLWNSRHPKHPWESNPWTWCYELKEVGE